MNPKISKYCIVFLCLLGYSNICVALEDQSAGSDNFLEVIAEMKNPFSSPPSVKRIAPVIEIKKKEIVSKVTTQVAPVVVEKVIQAPVNPPVLKITGLVWNSAKPQAIINGKIVGVGGEVDGAKLIAVRKSEIDVIFSGQTFTLNLNQPLKNDIKKSK